MQKLEQRTVKPNTPTSASQARSDCGLQLNRDENLSVASAKTCFNNPEVNPSQQAARPKAVVLVISCDKQPLMPCSAAKAKKLLKSKRAKIVSHAPFVIQLLFECENVVQEITAGIDAGYKHIGISATTQKKEVFSAEILLDGKTKERMTTRKMYRRLKRSRLRYRERRCLNRKRKEGWLAPSVQRKVDTHVNALFKLAKYLPISKVKIEAANFDIQKIMNPEITSDGYQQGDLYGHENELAYLLAREQGKCQFCSEGTDGNGWHIHHIKPVADGGTNRMKNKALLHKSCHKKIHGKNLLHLLKPGKEFKAEAFMSTARPFIIAKLKKHFIVEETFGYFTKIKRKKFHIEKSHENDAFVIAGGENQERCIALLITQKHRNNRSLGQQRKGYAPATRRRRYPIQPKDLVWVNGKKITSKGTANLGNQVLLQGQGKKTVVAKKIEKVFHFGSMVYEFKKCA